MKIIIDTQEKKPVLYDKIGDPRFPDLDFEFSHLKTGDYSIEGYTDPSDEFSVTIERKSLADLFQTVGHGRDRFQREIERMAEFDHAEIVVEADLKTMFEKPPDLSQMKPKAVYRSLMAWSQRYGIQVWACPSRRFAEKHIFLTLKRFYDDRQLPNGKMLYSKI